MTTVGTRVTWVSSGTPKEGVITHVLPKGKVPRDVGVLRLENSGLHRDHETYIVRGQHLDHRTKKPAGRKENYWPRVSLLTFHADGGAPTVQSLTDVLWTIANFPITDPRANMDAANMQRIAKEAISGNP